MAKFGEKRSRGVRTVKRNRTPHQVDYRYSRIYSDWAKSKFMTIYRVFSSLVFFFCKEITLHSIRPRYDH
jgi:hypothetical protein